MLNPNNSFRRMIVIFVLFIMLSSAFLTGAAFTFLRLMNLLPDIRLISVWMPVITLAVSTFLGTVISAILSVRLLRPLNELIRATRKVGEGDFSVRVENRDGDGEFAELIRSFNHMTTELGGIEMFRSDFINTFSHEFKTPIVSIRGFAKRLKKENLTKEQRDEYIDIIIAESERLANMSTNVLLLNKFEHQSIVTDRADFSLDEQLRNCILLLEKEWRAKDIRWKLELYPITYNGNAEIISHIWVNLFSNAVKFSDAGGEIAVIAEETDDAVLVCVRDHGPGMDSETLARIFDKFYQGDTSHASEGNGLGLSLVKRVTELCGGSVDVKSAPGEGAAFTVRLPK